MAVRELLSRIGRPAKDLFHGPPERPSIHRREAIEVGLDGLEVLPGARRPHQPAPQHLLYADKPTGSGLTYLNSPLLSCYGSGHGSNHSVSAGDEGWPADRGSMCQGVSTT